MQVEPLYRNPWVAEPIHARLSGVNERPVFRLPAALSLRKPEILCRVSGISAKSRRLDNLEFRELLNERVVRHGSDARRITWSTPMCNETCSAWQEQANHDTAEHPAGSPQRQKG